VDGEQQFINGCWTTLRGVKLAVKAVTLGATRDQVNRFNSDDIATTIANRRPEEREELELKALNEVLSS
jgi:hypothetical protein